ncbi:MAG: hypothetical protein JXL80_04100 [Planctomycetes bacterium]|nr:hypothetical protein [Planctomycetota bacterium]
MSERIGNPSAKGISKVAAARPALVVMCLVAAALGGCTPADALMQRIAAQDETVRPVLRDAVWAHGNPYVWSARKNLVIETHWADYRRGFEAIESRRIYCIDLTSRRMRIDDLTTQTTSMYDGATWRVFFRGKAIAKPLEVTDKTVGRLFMFEQAADEMRFIRELFCMPFTLLGQGVRLSPSGQVRSPAGGNLWNVVRADFDPMVTGHWYEDRLYVYFDPVSDRVDRAMMTIFDTHFNGIPHWGEWSEYRRVGDDGPIMPHILDFRMTDAEGVADLGRHLSIAAEAMAFDVNLPLGVYSNLNARPPKLPPQADAKPRQLGRDPVHTQKP